MWTTAIDGLLFYAACGMLTDRKAVEQMKSIFLFLGIVGMLWLSGCGAPPLSAESDTPVSTTSTTATTTTTVAAPVFREEGTQKQVSGDWRRLLTPVTEKAEQVDGYALLKKLRHKEKEAGYTFSAEMEGQLSVQGQEYYLCEIGHWVTTDVGSTYEFVAWLMVPTDLSAAYAAQVGRELTWNTEDNWLK